MDHLAAIRFIGDAPTNPPDCVELTDYYGARVKTPTGFDWEPWHKWPRQYLVRAAALILVAWCDGAGVFAASEMEIVHRMGLPIERAAYVMQGVGDLGWFERSGDPDRPVYTWLGRQFTKADLVERDFNRVWRWKEYA